MKKKSQCIKNFYIPLNTTKGTNRELPTLREEKSSPINEFNLYFKNQKSNSKIAIKKHIKTKVSCRMCMYVYVCMGKPEYESIKDNRKKFTGKIIALNV